MLRLTIPAVLGMFLASKVHLPLAWALSIFILVTLATIYLIIRGIDHRWRWKRGLMLGVWMFAFGAFWMTARDGSSVPRSIHHHTGNEGPWLVRMVTLNRLTDTQLRADAKVLAYYSGDEWRPASGTIMFTALRQADDPMPRVGDRMLVEAPMKRIMRVADPGGFDRQVWAAARGIELELFATWGQWQRVDHTTTWVDHFSVMRKRLSDWVDATELTDRERALVKALVLGQRDELDGEQRTAFARSGTIHVLAVSGMHVGLIYLILSFMFRRLGGGRGARIVRGILVLIALWLYAGITGGAPSILRATIMFSFITLADMALRRTESFNSVFAAMFLLLLWDPRMLEIIGFQLSFLAVLGIIMFFKPLEALWTPRTWFMRKVWSLAVLSIAAQTLTTPASLYYFKAFPLWFLPANLIVVSAVGISVYASIALIIFHKVPVLSDLITWVLTSMLTVVSETTAFFASMPVAYPVLRVGPVMVVLLYIMVLSMAAWWLWRWRSQRWVFVAASVSLLFTWGYNARVVNKGSTFTLYDERVGVLAAMTSGREHVVLVDPDRLINDPYAIRKIEQHRNAAGINRVELLRPDRLIDKEPHPAGNTVAAGSRWTSPDFDVLFVNPKSEPIMVDAGIRFDAVVIHDMEFIPTALLETAATVAEHIVIAGRTHWRSREQAFSWCTQRGIQVHDVFAQGAFILRQ